MSSQPTMIGRYELLSLLGTGAMGRVYEARLLGPSGFQKKVAVKVIRPRTTDQYELLRQNLIAEACAGGLLSHPNVVETFELGEADQQIYIVMEYVDGTTIEQFLRKTKCFSPQATVDIVSQMAVGLAHIHNAPEIKLLHCDLKPSNLMIDRYGMVKIADLGLSTPLNSQRNRLRGTPGYMSPEQSRAEQLDQRSDIFSVGLIFYELLTGKRFFPGVNSTQLLAQLINVETMWAKEKRSELMLLAPDLVSIIERCLRFDPAERFRSVGEMLRAIRRLPRQRGTDLYHTLEDLGIIQTSQHINQPKNSEPSLTDSAKLKDYAREQVPAPTKSLIAMTDNCETVLQMWSNGDRFLRLCGTEGVGKSTMLHQLHQTLNQQNRFVIKLDLQTVSCEQDLVDELLGALRLSEQNECRESLLQLADTLTNVGSIYWILDNTSGLDNALLGKLLELCVRVPNLCIVTASEQSAARQFSGEGCRVIRAQPFDAGTSWQLFKQRVREAGTRITHPEVSAELGQWRRLVNRCSGVPLVIELLAAEHRRGVPASEVDVGGVWKSSPLRGAFLQGMQHLDGQLQFCLSSLSRIEGRFHLSDAEMLLTELMQPVVTERDHSLLPVETILEHLQSAALLNGWSVKDGGEPSFSIPYGVRQIALSQLDGQPEKLRQTKSAFTGCFSRWSSLSKLHHIGELWLLEHRQSEHLPSILSALRVAIELKENRKIGALSLAAADIYSRQGPYSKGIALLNRYARVAEERQIADLELKLGQLYRLNGQHEKSKQRLQRAQRHYNEHQEWQGVLFAEAEQLFVLSDLGREYDEEAKRLATKLGQSAQLTPSEQLCVHRAIGFYYTQSGQLSDAINHVQQSFRLAWLLGDHRTSIGVLTTLGVLYFRLNKLDQARVQYHRAIEFAEEFALPQALDNVWMNLALIEILSGHPEQADALFPRAEKQYKQLGNIQALALLYANWALLSLYLAKPSVEDLLEQALKHLRTRFYPITAHTCYVVAGLWALVKQQPIEAVNWFQSASETVSEYQLEFKHIETEVLLIEALLFNGDVSQAEQRYQQLCSYKEKRETSSTKNSQVDSVWLNSAQCLLLHFRQHSNESRALYQRLFSYVERSGLMSRLDINYQLRRVQQALFA